MVQYDNRGSFVSYLHCWKENEDIDFEWLSLNVHVFESKLETRYYLEEDFEDYLSVNGLTSVIENNIKPDFFDKNEKLYMIKGDVYVKYTKDCWGEYDADFHIDNIDFIEIEGEYCIDDFISNNSFDLISFLNDKKAHSDEVFSNQTVEGVIDHIKEEIQEVENNTYDPEEWIDLLLLSFDGALKAGFTPMQITDTLDKKFFKNKQRKWDQSSDDGKKIKHLKDK